MSERAFTRASLASFVALVVLVFVVASCSGTFDGPDDGISPNSSAPAAGTTGDTTASSAASTSTGSEVLPPADDPDRLSSWNQLESRDGQLVLAEGVTPYTLNSPLFSDYAHKLRTVWIPQGAGAAAYQPDSPFDFPVGTVVTKTFYYAVPDDGQAAEARVLKSDPPSDVVQSLDLDDVRLVETRVLVHREDGWHGLPYVWNAEETEATLQRTGEIVQLDLIDAEGEVPLTYVVPDVNQCASCHATNHSTGTIELIGLQARHLNTEVDLGSGVASQLVQWQELGLLSGAPSADAIPTAAVWNDDAAPLEERARAYLDINCAHCHNSVGAADTSGLFLDISTEIGYAYGICKPPVAAGSGSGGRLFDIVPGESDESILVYRMESTDPAARMPELGRSTTHTEAVDVIADWIDTLDGEC